MDDARSPGREALTMRQRQIAALVARGYTNQQIATELVITPGTAANHIQAMMRRLEMSSRAELAAWATEFDLGTAQNRLLGTLQRLLEIHPLDMDSALDSATVAVAEALGAEKVDAFLYDPTTTTLVARGTSPTPLGRKQHGLGLHLLPVANGGRMVEVYQTGTPRRSGRVDRDRQELRGIRVELGVRSDITVPLEVRGERRGVLSAVSTTPEFFSEGDLQFLATVSRWVGMVAHRAELVEAAEAEAAARGRRTAAEELITVLAHDFRNFLTPLRGRLELLGRRASRDGHERYVRDAEEMIRSVDRLDRMVRDLLDTARLDQGLFGLLRRPVDLVELATQTAADFAATSESIEVRTGVDELVVFADPSRMRQVLENLLANALKVQPPDQRVVVELGARPPWASIAVIDRGPGVPPDVVPKLFERFAPGTGSVGLGLGLYLARGIVIAHGGKIDLESSPRAGTKFVVRLPLEAAGVEVPPHAPANGASGKQVGIASRRGAGSECTRHARAPGDGAG
jgi:signal transduction histidine kinase/DNA-binding CsgD family transcriptional regulator